MKKMKHLLQALLRWRSQRLAWQSCGGRSGRNMDEALSLELELLPSKRHNDLLLRFAGPAPEVLAEKPWAALGQVLPCSGEEEEVGDALSPEVSTVASTTSSAVQEELAALRAENEKLRSRNNALEKSVRDQDSVPEAQLPENLFDNPYEPPPQVWHGGWSSASSPTASTVARSTFSGSDGTPMGSGCVTPVQLAPVGQAITLVPMGWFAMGDRGLIPCGLVQQARAVFEQHTAIPNWFMQQFFSLRAAPELRTRNPLQPLEGEAAALTETTKAFGVCIVKT
eukprot:s1140_g8.t1